jgi:hypothetical protein
VWPAFDLPQFRLLAADFRSSNSAMILSPSGTGTVYICAAGR